MNLSGFYYSHLSEEVTKAQRCWISFDGPSGTRIKLLFCSRPSCPPASDVYPSLTPALHYPDDRFFPGGSLPLLTQGPHRPPSQQPERAHLTVAVASEFGDEADVVVPDLDHLLADVVLRTDTALGARPPGQRIIGSERVLALGAWWDRLLPLTSCSWCLDKAAKPLGGNKR